MSKYFYILLFFIVSCSARSVEEKITAATILGNPDYQAICYEGYRTPWKDVTVPDKILKN